MLDRRIGAQYYTLREQIKTIEEFDETCRQVKEIGYQIVQISGCPLGAAEMKEVLDKMITTNAQLAVEIHSRQSINQIMNECLAQMDLPVEKMGKYDRMLVIQMLHERNVFQMQKAVPYVADRLKISRYTIYNYLRELNITP